jgi:hypothetical protein
VSKNPEKSPTDWEAIEREYRNGQLSVSEIGRHYNVSHTAINKKAKKEGWKRDLTEKVRQEIASRLVSDEFQRRNARETIEEAAARGVQLVREHRSDIQANRSAVTELIAELIDTNAHREEIEETIYDETETEEGDSPAAKAEKAKKRARMLAAVALPSRANIANTLASALKTLIPLERQAFNLDERGNPPDGSADNPVNVTLDATTAERLKHLVE